MRLADFIACSSRFSCCQHCLTIRECDTLSTGKAHSVSCPECNTGLAMMSTPIKTLYPRRRPFWLQKNNKKNCRYRRPIVMPLNVISEVQTERTSLDVSFCCCCCFLLFCFVIGEIRYNGVLYKRGVLPLKQASH